MHDKKSLRQLLRQRRQELPPEQQQKAANSVAKQFIQSDYFSKYTHFSAYIAHNGELNPHPIVQEIWRAGKHCYLPVLDPEKTNQLCFMAYQPQTPLLKNKFGIEEPVHDAAQTISPEQLDVVLLPLVAFDKTGHRLGMGAGFYDRSFAERSMTKKPLLVGLAHELQLVDKVPTDPWDIPLDCVISDKKIYFS